MRTRKRKQQRNPDSYLQEATCNNLLSQQQQSIKQSSSSMMGKHRANEKWPIAVPMSVRTIVAAVVISIVSTAANKQLLVSASTATTNSNHHLNTNNNAPSSGIRFSHETNAYTGLTFTFDPRLDKRVEWLHFEHWLSIMHQSSELLHEALNGRAHLGEVRVLIPYKWRQVQWPVLNKPGAPVIMNRRIRYTDSDVIVGFDDPIYKETPFAVQHDECARQGLHISMPISFLEQQDDNKQSNDPRLKARLLVREFASHRYGLFKESGFRNDYMYPPFASLAGLSLLSSSAGKRNSLLPNHRTMLEQNTSNGSQSNDWLTDYALSGFDPDWNECTFDTQAQNGLPSQQSSQCLPYLTRVSPPSDKSSSRPSGGQSFNLMSADPFSHADLSARFAASHHRPRPVEWRDLADSVKWHFCGDNLASGGGQSPMHRRSSSHLDEDIANNRHESYAHNQLANNKQNVFCQERSAMEIIKASEDFKRPSFSPSTFNRLPAPNFSFLQEMPPRVILCVEYVAHLFQSRRLDHGILEAAIGKFLAYDLIADSEIALVLFGQRNSSRQSFDKLDSSIKSRLTLYNPAIDPFDEPVRYYTEQELAQIFSSSSTALNTANDHPSAATAAAANQQPKIVKGTCSFSKLMQEVTALQQQRNHQYDDVGADIVIISSGLFIEDESKIEDIIRSSFKPDLNHINLIIYPSTMLFDTKSHSHGYSILDALESEAIVRNRLSKLLLIQRLTNADIHLVKEHLDYNGDVKMSTLIQFYQIFDHIVKGHSWNQQQSMMLLAHDNVPSPPAAGSNKLQFQFHVDSSIQNELIVAFIDPKQHMLVLKPGNRFVLRNLELRSPGGHLMLTDSHPWPISSQSISSTSHHEHQSSAAADQTGSDMMLESRAGNEPVQDEPQPQSVAGGGTTNMESALFPFRTQLGLAGFHLKPAHLASLLNSTSGSAGKISGLWTLSATSDEPLQTSAIAMARVNPAGDTITSNCWIQTYYDESVADANGEPDLSSSDHSSSGMLKSVKVFAQTRGPAEMGPVQDVQARLEVQDELGNIIQNVNMLDDGLGAPDITRGDGIHSQYVQRAYRPGFYKVSVEMTGSGKSKQWQPASGRNAGAGLGQDSSCCGSFVPTPAGQVDLTRHLSRQLYCGTFYVDANNRLGQQRPPRINNLTIINVDQELRRVTLRWFEPSTDVSTGKGIRLTRSTGHGSERSRKSVNDDVNDILMGSSEATEIGSVKNHLSSARGSAQQQQLQEPGNRYEIKLFSDRDILKRSFDAKLEVGYKFNELSLVDGSFPNASSYGGMKEVTLRLPNGREGIYYIAMKVYNNLGTGSLVSNIVQLWIRSNMTEQEELESIYGQSVTVDANGNVYDKNGELIGQRGFAASSSGGSNGLLRVGTSNTLEGIGVLLFISACALLFLILSIWMFACIVSSARRSMAAKQDPNDELESKSAKQTKNKKRMTDGNGSTAILANGGSGSSSMVSSTSQCEASSRSSGHGDSLGTGSIGGGSQHDINKLSLAVDEAEHLSYSQLRQQHQLQQQQADHIKQAYLKQQQQSQYPTGMDGNKQANNWHTIVNGYAYATVANPQQFSHDSGDLNQNGLGPVTGRQGTDGSWPADPLLATSHYDKLKGEHTSLSTAQNHHQSQSHAHPHRVELIDGSNQLSSIQKLMNGLPQVPDEYDQSSYLIRDQHQLQNHQMPSYFNHQLQQQLSSVLKSKRLENNDDTCHSSPALEGVAQDGHEANFQDHDLANYLAAPPPPAQYIYQCAEANIHHQDPTIYSQATGLQQVMQGNPANDTGYYANSSHYNSQYAPAATNITTGIYGSSSNHDPYNQQLGLPESDNCLEESYENPNSAISEV